MAAIIPLEKFSLYPPPSRATCKISVLRIPLELPYDTLFWWVGWGGRSGGGVDGGTLEVIGSRAWMQSIPFGRRMSQLGIGQSGRGRLLNADVTAAEHARHRKGNRTRIATLSSNINLTYKSFSSVAAVISSIPRKRNW